MKRYSATVFIVDDDSAFLEQTGELIESAGYSVKKFISAEEFLAYKNFKGPGCILLDMLMPGLSGIEVQNKLIEQNILLPVVFITGLKDVRLSVQAMKKGAINFLLKPFGEQELISSIEEALERDRERLKFSCISGKVKQRLKNLTEREYQVLTLIINGMLNKQAAAKLGVSEKTIKAHRGRVMRKMQASSFAELMYLAQISGINYQPHQNPIGLKSHLPSDFPTLNYIHLTNINGGTV